MKKLILICIAVISFNIYASCEEDTPFRGRRVLFSANFQMETGTVLKQLCDEKLQIQADSLDDNEILVSRKIRSIALGVNCTKGFCRSKDVLFKHEHRLLEGEIIELFDNGIAKISLKNNNQAAGAQSFFRNVTAIAGAISSPCLGDFCKNDLVVYISEKKERKGNIVNIYSNQMVSIIPEEKSLENKDIFRDISEVKFVVSPDL